MKCYVLKTPLRLHPPGKTAWLCRLPYPGHKRGCPNASRCPGDYISPSREGEIVTLFVIEFRIDVHAAKMKAAHPSWTDAQCRCVLYWQNTVRKQLREFAQECGADSRYIDLIPESRGVNVSRMMRESCHRLEWPPVHVVHKVAIALAPEKE